MTVSSRGIYGRLLCWGCNTFKNSVTSPLSHFDICQTKLLVGTSLNLDFYLDCLANVAVLCIVVYIESTNTSESTENRVRVIKLIIATKWPLYWGIIIRCIYVTKNTKKAKYVCFGFN